MSTTYDGFSPENTAAQDDAPMFASTPVWDRKRKGLGPRRTSGVTTAAPAASTFDSEDAMTRPVGAEGAPRTVRAKRSGAAPAIIGATAVSLVAFGAAGWWMGRDTSGVPELTPGATPSTTTAAAPVAAPRMAAAEPATHAQVPYTAAEPTAQRAAPPARRLAAAPRVRPAAGAATSGVDASATLPDGPQPYSALNTQAATAAPTVEAAPIPSTPPVQSAPETPDPAPTAPAPQDAPTT